MNIFDDNNVDRLQALASLKRRCLHWEYMGKGLISGSTFFSDLSDEIDIPLLFIMNDELTNSNNRSGIFQLIESFVSENKYYNYIEISNGAFYLPDTLKTLHAAWYNWLRIISVKIFAKFKLFWLLILSIFIDNFHDIHFK